MTYIPFPKYIYHPEHEPKIVHNEQEFNDCLINGWVESPEETILIESDEDTIKSDITTTKKRKKNKG